MRTAFGAANPCLTSSSLWAIRPQALAAQNKQLQIQSNKATPLPPNAPKLSDIKLIDYDFAKYGSSEERKRLLSKWDEEVASLPQ